MSAENDKLMCKKCRKTYSFQEGILLQEKDMFTVGFYDTSITGQQIKVGQMVVCPNCNCKTFYKI